MIIELHLLQSFPASNLNRDDVGQPKSVTFGGVTRGRISSQCLKRSARGLFPRFGLGADERGVRTKRLLLATARILDGTKGEPTDETKDIVREALRVLGFKVTEEDLTQYLFFLGRDAAEHLADFCRQHRDRLEKAAAARRGEGAKKKDGKTKKVGPDAAAVEAARHILSAGRAADIALFGRMIANNRDFNVDAASQVAHAVSTHAVTTEFDYYTAVDDLKSAETDEDAGADMIGTVDFNAACYYRYANVNLAQLEENLAIRDDEDDLVERATSAWIKAFVQATPSGKQNSMAAHTRPEALLAVVREHSAWNLANAFLKPVEGTDIMGDSTERMLKHFTDLNAFYGDGEIKAVIGASPTGALPHLEATSTVTSLGEFTDRIVAAAREKR
ncbi:CRISPR system Cascade subunit CasC [Spinactinospora alkalitolerans]|uniref:CRISPR system Cascade subunit CasC n=1 Tax=Spinactinospora alkalitolerans TaxID=687207 RepID=A0A852U9S8_9ACTN|nr:type I-E CRISPR-associated protein Cas7/Cse4/CasC [Spinactinospora alkalitolerans]NYE50710.1 CRISPR system Cascade subunit CasC [Spinactinospora alkalitolerans]